LNLSLKYLIVIVSLLFGLKAQGQVVYYQETCQCGVTGAGFSTEMGSGSGNFAINIEPGSTVKKAYLFGIRFWDNNIPITPTNIILNSSIYTFDSTNETGISFDAFGNYLAKNITIHSIDITNDIIPTNLNQSITIPDQNTCAGCSFGCFYLYVLYENVSFTQNITSYIALNNQNESNSNQYELTILNQVLNTSPIGFAVYLDRMNTLMALDGSILYFNNGNIINTGLMKGSDNVNLSWIGAGVKGHFYFQNNTLFGLDDDTPDNLVGGTDGLLDASSYLHPDGSLKWKLNWENTSNPNGTYNIYNGFFIEHSTLCDTFSVSVPSDTTICRGASLQLNASGGSNYEWQPATDLSCSSCPNPVFTGDSTQLYTVRIWNNDSCSVVRPVKVKVQSCAGLNEEMLASAFSSYPNPSNGNFTLENEALSTAFLTVEVIDLLGKINYSETINFDHKHTLAISLAAGTYILKVSDEQHTFSTQWIERIVVE